MINGLRVIGSGTSSSTPALRCVLSKKGHCARCDDAIRNPNTSKNRRNNVSLLVHNNDLSVLIDVGKTFRDSALRVPWPKYPPLGAIALTHWHLDAMGGLDDVREFSTDPIPLFCDAPTVQHVHRLFPYLVQKSEHIKYIGQLQINPVPMGEAGSRPIADVDVCGISVTFLPLYHGPDCTAAGFVFKAAEGKRVAYLSDVGRLDAEKDEAVIDALRGQVDILFLDCMAMGPLRPGLHIPGHFVLPQAVEAVRLIRPKQVFLTGIGHGTGHDELTKQLNLDLAPELKSRQLEFAGCAWDGLEMKF